MIAHDYKMPYTWQSILGFQTQVAEVWGVEADFTHWKGYNFARQRDPNLFFDPVTGYNRNPTTAGRPDPKFTRIQWLESNGRADYAAISSALTRRFRNNYQATRHLHVDVVHERQHHQLPVRGRQPVQPGGGVVALDGLPAPHACG